MSIQTPNTHETRDPIRCTARDLTLDHCDVYGVVRDYHEWNEAVDTIQTSLEAAIRNEADHE